MFGCGLPVCAVNYSCIGELVAHGRNGVLFSDAEQLAGQWLDLLQGFPSAPTKALREMRHVVEGSMAVRWEDSWRGIAWPPLREQLEGRR